MSINKEYWFVLDSTVYIEIVDKNVLFINTVTNALIEFNNPNSIYQFAKKLKNMQTSYVISVSSEELENDSFYGKLKLLIDNFMGDLLLKSDVKHKPISLKPIPKLHKSFEFTKVNPNVQYTELTPLITDITLYINDECSNQCSSCTVKHKQITFCTRSENKNTLSLEHIDFFMSQIPESQDVTIQITGGNILFHNQLPQIVNRLNKKNIDTKYLIHYMNFDESKMNFLVNSNVNLLIDFPINPQKMDTVLETIIAKKFNVSYSFAISSIREYEEVEQLVTMYNLKSYLIKPYYNGKNYSFFKNNIFLNKGDIYELDLTLKCRH